MLAIEMVLQAVPPFLRPCCDDPSILPRKPPGSRELDTTPHDQRMTSKGPWWFLTSCPAQLVRRHLRRPSEVHPVQRAQNLLIWNVLLLSMAVHAARVCLQIRGSAWRYSDAVMAVIRGIFECGMWKGIGDGHDHELPQGPR